jgi:hypothetical protein
MKKPNILLLSAILFLLLKSLLWGKDINLNSIWTKSEIMVDGKESEWSGKIYYLENQKIGIGLQNDTSNLYILVKATDWSRQMQIMRTGLTIWLDATGKNKKSLGIHYPIGMQEYGIPDVKANPNTEFESEQKNRSAEMLKEIEVLGPEKNDRNRIPRANNFGIEASLSDTLGVMVYELKIPLQGTNEHPYAISAGQGSAISVGLEGGKFNREMMGNRMRMRGGMPGGEGGMRPGGMMPGEGQPPESTSVGGRERGKMLQPIDLWTKVSLAKTTGDNN